MKLEKGSIFISIILILLVVVCFLIAWPSFQGYFEHSRLSKGYKNLLLLIEAEDEYFSKNGYYLPINPSSNISEEKGKLNWCTSNCSSCEYAVTVSGTSFTATVRCPLDDGTFNYLGFVQTPLGKHMGIDGEFGKCKSKGIFTHQRSLVNTVGPCFEQDKGILSIASGTKKRLVVHTFPSHAMITANGNFIGETSSNHKTISPRYGSFFWAEPYAESINIKITKEGFHPVQFQLDWGSYTYTAKVVLRPK